MKVVIFADTTNEVGRVHKNIADQLKEYKFIFHDKAKFYYQNFKDDVASSDICITTTDCYTYIISEFKTPEELKKIIVITHNLYHIKNLISNPDFKKFSNYITYGVTSDILANFHPMKPVVCLSGINASLFNYRERSGIIKTLGWSGIQTNPSKRFDWSLKIANNSELPISIASNVSFKTLNNWYDSIDILLITSGPDITDESGPLSAYEAIACGVLVIGTSVGNFSHIPGPKFSTIEEATICINSLKNDPEYVRALAKEQYIFVMNNFTMKTTIKAWKSLIDTAVTRPRNVEDSTNASQVQFQFSSPLT